MQETQVKGRLPQAVRKSQGKSREVEELGAGKDQRAAMIIDDKVSPALESGPGILVIAGNSRPGNFVGNFVRDTLSNFVLPSGTGSTTYKNVTPPWNR